MNFDRKKFTNWLSNALFAQTGYFKVRRKLFEELKPCMDSKGDFKVSSEDFSTIRTYLTQKQNNISNEATLAFSKVVNDLWTECGSDFQHALVIASPAKPAAASEPAGDNGDGASESGKLTPKGKPDQKTGK